MVILLKLFSCPCNHQTGFTSAWILCALYHENMQLVKRLVLIQQVSEADKNSRRSSIQEELAQQQQQQQQPHIRIPSPESGDSFYFAPISPAAKTTTTSPSQQQQQQQQQEHQQQQLNPLMELLRGNASGA